MGLVASEILSIFKGSVNNTTIAPLTQKMRPLEK